MTVDTGNINRAAFLNQENKWYARRSVRLRDKKILMAEKSKIACICNGFLFLKYLV